MELESLKYIWHSLETPAPAETGEQELLALLQKRSHGPVARMRRNLLIESIIAVLVYIPASLFYYLNFNGQLSIVSWMFIALLAGLIFYFYRKNSLLKEMQCLQCQVKDHLERQVRTLKKYVRFYVLAGTLLLPIMFVLTWFIIRWKLTPIIGYDPYEKLVQHYWWASPRFWLLLLPLFTLGLYYLNAWYVKKLYGRHIEKLESILEELNSTTAF